VRFDRKLLLIAPTIVLFCVAAGLVYAAMQLRVLGSVSDSWNERSAFISAVEAGQKPLETRQAVGLLRWALDVESRRTAAIAANRDLVIVLASMAIVSCCVLAIGIRSVPREHWPRLSFKRPPAA
jgi:hypothetical protein